MPHAPDQLLNGCLGDPVPFLLECISELVDARLPRMSHKCSIGDRSGDFACHGRVVIVRNCRWSWTTTARWALALSSWNRSHFRSVYGGSIVCWCRVMTDGLATFSWILPFCIIPMALYLSFSVKCCRTALEDRNSINVGLYISQGLKEELWTLFKSCFTRLAINSGCTCYWNFVHFVSWPLTI